MSMLIKIGKLRLKNPVLVASGTFGYAEEFAQLVDLNKIGAIISKTITLKPRPGNKPPRVYETASGMLNAIGLQNEGIYLFLLKKIPIFEKIKSPLIVSISAQSAQEFKKLAKILDKVDTVKAIELNLSCPNIEHKHGLLAQDPKATCKVVKAVKNATKKTVIAKLSPNVTDIRVIAKAAEKAGVDALSMVNTFLAMAVDTRTRKPVLGNGTGGLSGPAIKPIALRMVNDVYNVVKIPIIASGGIMSAQDAIEFFICGASAVCLGTVNFVKYDAAEENQKGIISYLKKNKITLKKLIGSLKK